MRGFQRGPGGSVSAQFDPGDAVLLQSLAGQVAGLLREAGAEDPAMARLLPDAYRDDADASAEFRRFTADGLAGRKVSNAETVIRSLDEAEDSGRVTLDAPAAQAWLRSLTDIRLTLAVRLGIERDDQGPAGDTIMQDVYDWLGFIQNSLVEALEP